MRTDIKLKYLSFLIILLQISNSLCSIYEDKENFEVIINNKLAEKSQFLKKQKTGCQVIIDSLQQSQQKVYQLGINSMNSESIEEKTEQLLILTLSIQNTCDEEKTNLKVSLTDINKKTEINSNLREEFPYETQLNFLVFSNKEYYLNVRSESDDVQTNFMITTFIEKYKKEVFEKKRALSSKLINENYLLLISKSPLNFPEQLLANNLKIQFEDDETQIMKIEYQAEYFLEVDHQIIQRELLEIGDLVNSKMNQLNIPYNVTDLIKERNSMIFVRIITSITDQNSQKYSFPSLFQLGLNQSFPQKRILDSSNTTVSSNTSSSTSSSSSSSVNVTQSSQNNNNTISSANSSASTSSLSSSSFSNSSLSSNSSRPSESSVGTTEALLSNKEEIKSSLFDFDKLDKFEQLVLCMVLTFLTLITLLTCCYLIQLWFRIRRAAKLTQIELQDVEKQNLQDKKYQNFESEENQ